LEDVIMANTVRNVMQDLDVPKEGTLSKVIANTDNQNVTLFMMGEGEYMHPHTATMEATVLTLKGSAEWTLGDEAFSVKEGDWFVMPKNMVHSIKATAPYAFLLTLHKNSI
jgi:quercetin dioxygenase-like cupin family protein